MKGVLIMLVCLASLTSLLGQEAFKYGKIVFLTEGVELDSRELAKYENLEIAIVGVEGYNTVENMAELGMEVKITDENSKELMFTPDMLEKMKMTPEDVRSIRFNFDLREETKIGENYFIKIRLWDKLTNKEYTKETSVKILSPVENSYVTIVDNGFDYLSSKIYLNKSRYYTGNIVRKKDEVYVDIFFKDYLIKKKESINYEVEVYDVKNDKSYTVEKDVLVLSEGETLNNFNYKIVMDGEILTLGDTYEFRILFENSSNNTKISYTYKFLYLDNTWKSNTTKTETAKTKVFLNQEKTKSGATLAIGDRLDFQVLNLNNSLVPDNGMVKVGVAFILKDSNGELIMESDDLFATYGKISSKIASEITLNYTLPWDIKMNSKYTVEAILWDKYGRNYYSNKFEFKTGKIKEFPYGLKLNSNIKFSVDEDKIEPVSVVVYKNGYKYEGKELKAGDVIVMKSGSRKKEGVNPIGFRAVTLILDAEGNVLSESTEEITKFEEGNLFANITIPYEGLEYGKEMKLISKLLDIKDEILVSEYTFVIVK